METIQTTITNPEKPIGRYVVEPMSMSVKSPTFLKMRDAILRTFEEFRDEAATRGNCKDMVRRLDFQLGCLSLYVGLSEDDEKYRQMLTSHINDTIETLKTGFEEGHTIEVIDVNEKVVKYDTSTPTGFLLANKDVFDKMTLVDFANSGYCKVMEMKGWGDHYDCVEHFNEVYPRMGMARLKAIHQNSRLSMAQFLKDECKRQGVPYTRAICQENGVAYLDDNTTTATVTVTTNGQEATTEA